MVRFDHPILFLHQGATAGKIRRFIEATREVAAPPAYARCRVQSGRDVCYRCHGHRCRQSQDQSRSRRRLLWPGDGCNLIALPFVPRRPADSPKARARAQSAHGEHHHNSRAQSRTCGHFSRQRPKSGHRICRSSASAKGNVRLISAGAPLHAWAWSKVAREACRPPRGLALRD
jgi:hypothetical protein